MEHIGALTAFCTNAWRPANRKTGVYYCLLDRNMINNCEKIQLGLNDFGKHHIRIFKFAHLPRHQYCNYAYLATVRLPTTEEVSVEENKNFNMEYFMLHMNLGGEYVQRIYVEAIHPILEHPDLAEADRRCLMYLFPASLLVVEKPPAEFDLEDTQIPLYYRMGASNVTKEFALRCANTRYWNVLSNVPAPLKNDKEFWREVSAINPIAFMANPDYDHDEFRRVLLGMCGNTNNLAECYYASRSWPYAESLTPMTSFLTFLTQRRPRFSSTMNKNYVEFVKRGYSEKSDPEFVEFTTDLTAEMNTFIKADPFLSRLNSIDYRTNVYGGVVREMAIGVLKRKETGVSPQARVESYLKSGGDVDVLIKHYRIRDTAHDIDLTELMSIINSLGGRIALYSLDYNGKSVDDKMINPPNAALNANYQVWIPNADGTFRKYDICFYRRGFSDATINRGCVNYYLHSGKYELDGINWNEFNDLKNNIIRFYDHHAIFFAKCGLLKKLWRIAKIWRSSRGKMSRESGLIVTLAIRNLDAICTRRSQMFGNTICISKAGPESIRGGFDPDVNYADNDDYEDLHEHKRKLHGSIGIIGIESTVLVKDNILQHCGDDFIQACAVAAQEFGEPLDSVKFPETPEYNLEVRF